MAGYYIQGLLNTETAYDSYCIYGYKSDIDKRYFCAVRISNVFYSSYRESAYINVYIYCKGQQVSTLKCISNTGSEYDVSVNHEITSDPTVAKIYSHDVWSNMNGRQATMADFISNVPILNGVNLSDEERDALAINYLNNVPEPYGQGTVTLTIKRPGQTLNFTSRLLSKTVRRYITDDATIDIQNASSDWEILWQFNFGGDNGQILINSDFEAINDLLTKSLTGDLLRSAYESSANNVYAQKNIVAKSGKTDELSAFTNVSADQMFSAFSGYDRLIIAKSGSGISMPFEVGFHWQVAQSMQMCLVKQDGTFVPHDYYVTGEYVTVSLYGFTTTAFNGTLKYYYATDPGSSAHQEGWVELDASVSQNVPLNVNMFIVFAIPS